MLLKDQFPLIYLLISISSACSLKHEKSATFSNKIENHLLEIKDVLDDGKCRLSLNSIKQKNENEFCLYPNCNKTEADLTIKIF